MFGIKGRRQVVLDSTETDPRVAEINRQERDIRRSVKALELQASAHLGRDYRSKRVDSS